MTAAGTRSGAKEHVPALDGLRAVAVGAVLCFHGGWAWAEGGFLGVSTFFTLSGFLITGLLVSERTRRGSIDLRRFWVRRFRRLLPAALLTLLAVALLAPSLAAPEQLDRLRPDALAALFDVANWRFLLAPLTYGQLFTEPSPVQHFWSLAIEEQFYLVFPLVVAGLLALARGSRRLLVVMLGALTFGSVVLMAALHTGASSLERVYYGTDTRAAELLIGALLALWMLRRREQERPSWRHAVEPVGLIALVATFWAYSQVSLSSEQLFEGGLPLFALGTAGVIRAAVEPGTAVARVLALRPLQHLGRISYGVYLYHWPVFIWLDAEATGLDHVPLFALQVLVTLTAAELSYRFVEMPIRQRGLPRVPWRTALVPLAVGGVALALVIATIDPPRPAIDFTVEAADPPLRAPVPTTTAPPNDFVILAQFFAYLEGIPQPRVPPSTGPPRIVLVGDSIAWSLGLGLAPWGADTGQADAFDRGLIGCGMAKGGELRTNPGFPVQPCDDSPGLWYHALETVDPELVVFLTGVWDLVDRKLPEWRGFHGPGDRIFDDWLTGEYVRLVTDMSSRGAKVAWLTSPCAAPTEGPLMGTEAVSSERVRYFNRRIIPLVQRQAPVPINVVDLHEHVCPGGQYTGDLDGVSGARPDGFHFTEDGAYAVSEWLGPQLVSIVRP